MQHRHRCSFCDDGFEPCVSDGCAQRQTFICDKCRAGYLRGLGGPELLATVKMDEKRIIATHLPRRFPMAA